MSRDFRLSVDIVVPTVRANASGLRRVVELTVPPTFANLKIIIVVDGPQTADAWNALRSLAAEQPSGRVVLLSTRPNHHGWPAGAGAARNTGIEHSSADFILFFDDDTTPEPDVLFRYAEAAEHWLGDDRPDDDGENIGVFGFAGVTTFLVPHGSLWAIAARCSGMVDAFTAASRSNFPPWSPTANLMLRRTAPPQSAAAAAAAAAIDDGATSEAEEMESAAPLLPPPSTVPPPPERLPWCAFDVALPANGGGEDIDICLRASVDHPEASGSETLQTGLQLPMEVLNAETGWARPKVKQRLVAVPLAITTHKLWSVYGMLARGVRWGYAGGQISYKFPQLMRRRPMPNAAESCVIAAFLSLFIGGCVPRFVVWRLFLLSVLGQLFVESFRRVLDLPSRVRLSGYMPPNLRATLDEPAFEEIFGVDASRTVRWLCLIAIHGGPMMWLSVAFSIGEMKARLEWPWTPSKLSHLFTMWDFSFGEEEVPPNELVRKMAWTAWSWRLTGLVLALLAEAWLSGLLRIGKFI